MKKAILLATLTLGLLAATPKTIEPKINKYDGTLQLDIGKTVQDAIKKFDPYFQTWNETDFIPSIRENYKPSKEQTVAGVVGDFNNDKIKDVALFGRNRTHNLLLVALSDVATGNYKVVEVDRGPLTTPDKQWIEGPKGKDAGLWRYLNHRKPGWVSSPVEKQPLHLRAEGFEEVYYEKGSVLYYLKDGKFEKYTISH